MNLLNSSLQIYFNLDLQRQVESLSVQLRGAALAAEATKVCELVKLH